jgi:hypothetical protein
MIPSASGARIVEMRRLVAEEIGREKMLAAIASLPAAMQREYLEATAMTWVACATEYAVHDAIAAAIHEDPLLFHDRMLRAAMEKSFKTVWRLLLRFTSDEALIARTPIIYAKTRNVGKLTARSPARNRAEIVLSGYPHCTMRDVRAIGVGLEAALRLTGRRDVRLTSTFKPDGAIYLAEWR